MVKTRVQNQERTNRDSIDWVRASSVFILRGPLSSSSFLSLVVMQKRSFALLVINTSRNFVNDSGSQIIEGKSIFTPELPGSFSKHTDVHHFTIRGEVNSSRIVVVC